MRRPFLLALLIIIIDQGLKTYFQFFGFEENKPSNFGFTYTVNYALWINPNIKEKMIYTLFTFALLTWFLVIYLLNCYKKKYRKSIVVDIAFAFYTCGIIGNIIDRIIFGYIRDFFVTPFVVCNFADLCGFIGLFVFIFEFIVYPKSRNLLKMK